MSVSFNSGLMEWFCDQFSLARLHIGDKTAPAATYACSWRAGDDDQANRIVSPYCVTVLDTRRKKDEAALLQIKRGITTSEGDRASST